MDINIIIVNSRDTSEPRRNGFYVSSKKTQTRNNIIIVVANVRLSVIVGGKETTDRYYNILDTRDFVDFLIATTGSPAAEPFSSGAVRDASHLNNTEKTPDWRIPLTS